MWKLEYYKIEWYKICKPYKILSDYCEYCNRIYMKTANFILNIWK